MASNNGFVSDMVSTRYGASCAVPPFLLQCNGIPARFCFIVLKIVPIRLECDKMIFIADLIKRGTAIFKLLEMNPGTADI